MSSPVHDYSCGVFVDVYKHRCLLLHFEMCVCVCVCVRAPIFRAATCLQSIVLDISTEAGCHKNRCDCLHCSRVTLSWENAGLCVCLCVWFSHWYVVGLTLMQRGWLLRLKLAGQRDVVSKQTVGGIITRRLQPALSPSWIRSSATQREEDDSYSRIGSNKQSRKTLQSRTIPQQWATYRKLDGDWF